MKAGSGRRARASLGCLIVGAGTNRNPTLAHQSLYTSLIWCLYCAVTRRQEMSSIETVLQEKRVFPPPAEFVKQANIPGMDAYRKMAAEAERDFEGFWARHARETLIWSKPFKQVLDESKAPFFRWFHDGELNASYNCLDRHLKTQGDKTAIIFEADDGKLTRISYRELHREVCRFANALKGMGIKPADRVLVYMPMSIQVVAAMLACARIGATHSVVFGGFSAKSVQERIIDAGAVAVIT